MAENDLLKRYLDAGMAFTHMTQKRAEAIVRDLVKAGELQREQAQAFVTELVERSRENTERLLDTVRAEVKAQLDARGVATTADIRKLTQRVEQLMGRSGRSDGTAASGAPKPPAPKPPASRSSAKKSSAKKSSAKKSSAKKQSTAKRKAPAKKRSAKRRPS